MVLAVLYIYLYWGFLSISLWQLHELKNTPQNPLNPRKNPSLCFFSLSLKNFYFLFFHFLALYPQLGLSDSQRMRWEKVQPQPKQSLEGAQQQHHGVSDISGPGKRWGHTCNAIKGGRFLYVFGGYGRDNCQTNQVHVFDTGGTSKFWLFFFVFFFLFPFFYKICEILTLLFMIDFL